MASASWSKETDEKNNYTKLCRLLVDGGTHAVRSVFDGIHLPSSLKLTLNTNKTTLQKLKKPKGKVLNTEQWDKLYPPSGSNPTSKDFDITLLFVLLRNICGLTPPVYKTVSGKLERCWDKLPDKTDTSREANLARIKCYRNTVIAHKPNTEISDAVFKKHWQDISSALLSLGLSQDDIDDLKSAPLGKKNYNQLLLDWYISDKDIKTELEEVKSNLVDIKNEQQIQKLTFCDFRAEINTTAEETMRNTEETRRTAEETMRNTEETRRTSEETKRNTEETRRTAEETMRNTEETRRTAEETKRNTEELTDLLRNLLDTGPSREDLQQPGVHAQHQEHGPRLVQQQLQQPNVQVQQQLQQPNVQVRQQLQQPQQEHVQGLMQPEVVIDCVFEFASEALRFSRVVLMDQYTSWDDIEALKGIINRMVLPPGVFLYKIIFGSIKLVTKVTSMDALTELWKRYKEGKLKTDLEKVLITKELIALMQSEVKLTVTINETEYLRAQEELQSKVIASASWSKETDEKINYTKLCRLLVDGGTHAVRSVFDVIHPPSSLKATLNANKTTLQKLKKPKGKVLNNEQWDKLYPPSGSNPTSKDFDITLLFVLLRKICGLTPPATGWDVLPPVTDTSREANLARIKYYRNNTIAHKPNTEMSDADFHQHWQDISSALLFLGLSQDDIDELKSAPLGKKNYNQLLLDWYISDKDIKTQLEDVKSETADIKSDTEDIKSDIADIKSDTADIKSDTADIKSDTADIKSDTADIKSDTADIKSDTADIKSDAADIKSDTADIKSDTTDIKSDTADIKSDTADIKSDTADIKSDTADIKSDTADIKSDTTDIKSDTADIKSDTADLKSDTADIKNKLDDVYFKKDEQQIQKLTFCDFRPEINKKCNSFHPNTRQWIVDQVKSHVDSDQPDSCIMLITAGPGMGKSTIAAKICQTYKDLGRLAGCHFFQFSNSTRNNPRLMLQSIAKQMCDIVPGYQDVLERKLKTDLGKPISEMNCEELLTILLEEPLCNVEQPNSNLIVVIDALDECSYDPKDELLKALRKKLSLFPSWLRFVLTSRPLTNTSALGSTIAVKIKADDQANIRDLQLFYSLELKALYPQCHDDDNADLVQKLVKMTKGLFLVAFFVIEDLKRKNVVSPEKVMELFPNGISSVYENYFSRLKEVLLPYMSEKEGFLKMLDAVVATNNPLPKDMFYNILCLKSESEVPRHERRKRKDALNELHLLFPVEGDHVTPFHKSVIDWLTLHDDEEHDFSVRVEDGDEVLASQCNDFLSDIRNGEKDLDKPLNLTDGEKYALQFFCYLVKEKSPVVKCDKYGFFSNIFLLTALSIELNIVRLSPELDDIISTGSYLEIGKCLTMYSPRFRGHGPSCGHFFRPLAFGRYIAFSLQAAHAWDFSEGTTPKTLDALETYRYPYFDVKTLLHTKFEKQFQQLNLLKFQDGFLVADVSTSNSPSNTVCMFQLDGTLMNRKVFPSERLVVTSPDINFIVAAEERGKKIEILDAATLEVVSQYESPHDAIETCHVFENKLQWFIVIKGCHDNKVYVIEGLTGQVRKTITVTEGSTVKEVSCQGHIVVTRTWEHYEPEERKTFTNKNGELVEVMNWDTFPPTYREMFLYYYDHEMEPIPIHPAMVYHCAHLSAHRNVDEAICFSEDGRLLAYLFKHFIFIVNTSDGSLYKRVSYEVRSAATVILFVSRSFLAILDFGSVMSVINVQKDEVEHMIYLHLGVSQNRKQIVLLPKENGKSFDLIGARSKPGFTEVSRLVFHNLNLQGLQ